MAETNIETQKITRDIASHLDGWGYGKARSHDRTSGEPMPCGYLVHAETGATVAMRLGAYGRAAGMLEIFTVYDDRSASGERVYHNAERSNIGASASKGGKRLAGDIARRLAPDALAGHALVVQAVKDRDEYDGKATALRARLTDAGASAATKHNPEGFNVNTDGMEGWVSGKVSGETVTIELHSVSPGLALTILKAIKAARSTS